VVVWGRLVGDGRRSEIRSAVEHYDQIFLELFTQRENDVFRVLGGHVLLES
jgi:hypothetical protein